jgi:uncharacterized cofD-like protein
VLPSTLHNVRLVADVRLPHLVSEVRIEGESRIPEVAGRVRHVWLEPNDPPAFPDAVRAILGAELLVIGPGSLYTSLLPNLLVSDLAEALRVCRALRVYVCNVATQPGETDGYSCGDHVRALQEHVGKGLFDVVVVNNRKLGVLPVGVSWVESDDFTMANYRVYEADLVDEERPWRHDSEKLARVLIYLYQEKTGPLVE